MRRSRLPFTLAAILLAIALVAPGFAVGAVPGGPESDWASQAHQPGPARISGSVVLRDDAEVSAASVDFDAYAADRYIVRFASSVADAIAATDRLARTIGFSPTHIYTARVRGFAARLSAEQIAALDARPEVAAIEADDVIPAPSAYGMPLGVERVGALANPTAKIDGADQRVNVDVAVIDTGADLDHSDLNVTNWFDCTDAGGDGYDEAGHGTHVAGTIGALDNGAGVTGVAPGARIWSIKIFTADRGLESWAICGIELLADHGAQIDVANMSWGWWESGADGPCGETTVHQAICDAYNAGVTLVTAAGNQDFDAGNSVPATFSQVIAVSALVDTDGRIGGRGPASSYGCDDCFANFSNFGADIDLAAPGVNVLSTCPTYLSCNAGNGLARHTGTSMSSPHAAGAAALHIARNGRVGPANVRAALIANSDPTPMAGDSDGIRERVLYAGNLRPACTLAPTAASPGASAELACTNFRAGETVAISLDSSNATAFATFTASARGHGGASFAIPNATKGTHQVVAKGRTSGRVLQVSLRIAATMSLTPNSGPAGTIVTVRLAGFSKGESVTIRLDPGTAGERTLRTGVVIASNGAKTASVTIPASTSAGRHKIEAAGSLGTRLSRTFTVTVGATSVDGAEATTPAPSPTATASAGSSQSPTSTATMEPAPTETAPPTIEPSPTPTETPTLEPPPTEPTPSETATE